MTLSVLLITNQNQFINQFHLFCIKDDVTRSEILWALKVVDDKMSLNLCADIGETFKLMFPDSAAASNFKMGLMKCKYVINHGLAPYFSRKQKHNTLYFAVKLILPVSYTHLRAHET